VHGETHVLHGHEIAKLFFQFGHFDRIGFGGVHGFSLMLYVA
jgi:hypothetical protein